MQTLHAEQICEERLHWWICLAQTFLLDGDKFWPSIWRRRLDSV